MEASFLINIVGFRTVLIKIKKSIALIKTFCIKVAVRYKKNINKAHFIDQL